jgi:hypothetical protein
MGQRKSSLGIGGCIIPIIAVIIGTYNLLLKSGVLFFLFVGLGIFIFFWNKWDEHIKKNNKELPMIPVEVKPEIPIIDNKEARKDLDDINFLENLVFDLDENSTFEINISSNGQVGIYGLFFHKKKFDIDYKKEGEFKSINEAITYLRKNSKND